MITKEQEAAFALMEPEAIEEEIKERRALMAQMVGQLYPSILSEEIFQLREICNARKRATP